MGILGYIFMATWVNIKTDFIHLGTMYPMTCWIYIYNRWRISYRRALLTPAKTIIPAHLAVKNYLPMTCWFRRTPLVGKKNTNFTGIIHTLEMTRKRTSQHQHPLTNTIIRIQDCIIESSPPAVKVCYVELQRFRLVFVPFFSSFWSLRLHPKDMKFAWK